LIRQLPHHNSTPIVAVTAHAASGEREHLLQAGMDDYLAKPIDEKMLTRVLSRYHSGDVENAIADDAPLSL
ncbi:response regulator, partial [Escherichia coli]